MSGAKETPRQKMIGMMYLVYTALLAMNVSAEILDAFALVSEGQQTTNSSIEVKINEQYGIFQDQYNKETEKTQLYWDKAQEIRSKTDEIINYVENEVLLPLALKSEKLESLDELIKSKDPEKPLIKDIEKANPNNRRIFYDLRVDNFSGKDNTDAAINMMINEGKATELKEKLKEYRQFIVTTMVNAGLTNYNNRVGLLTDVDKDGNEILYHDANKDVVTWEVKFFNHVVFAAEVAILNQMVGEIQTTEYDAVSALMNRIGATDYKFNKLEARVVPKSDYIISGQDYEAEVFLVAADTMRSFDARYSLNSGAATTVKSEGGIIKLKFSGRNIGEQKFSGVIEMVSPETGEIEEYPFGSTFMVAQASATIAPTKMNVMYSGIKNPVRISAPGYKPNELNVRVTGGDMTVVDKAKGEYEIVPAKAGEKVHVIASAMKDGKSISICDEEFRVKQVPDPIATIGGKTGEISKTDILAAGKLEPTMRDFDFEVEYQILSFRYSKGGLLVNKNGANFDNEIKNDIREAKRGDRFFFSDIVVKKPDGKTTNLGNMFIIIK